MREVDLTLGVILTLTGSIFVNIIGAEVVDVGDLDFLLLVGGGCGGPIVDDSIIGAAPFLGLGNGLGLGPFLFAFGALASMERITGAPPLSTRLKLATSGELLPLPSLNSNPSGGFFCFLDLFFLFFGLANKSESSAFL